MASNVKVNGYSNCPGKDCVIFCQCDNQGAGVIWWNGSWFSSIDLQFSCRQNHTKSCCDDTVIGTASNVCSGVTSSTLLIRPTPDFSGDLMCYFHKDTSGVFVPVGKLTFSRTYVFCMLTLHDYYRISCTQLQTIVVKVTNI